MQGRLLPCQVSLRSEHNTHAEVFARFIVDDTTGFMTIKASWSNDEIGNIEGKETVAVETTRTSLRQHEGLGDNAIGIDVTEIKARKKTIVATGTQHEPARVGAPVVERLGVVGVGPIHKAVFAGREVEQPEVGLMMPNAELAKVGERVAEETSVVGRSGEGHRLILSLGIDNGVYTVAKVSRCRIEIDTAEIIANRVKLMAVLRKGTSCTEIERAAISREDWEGLIDRVLLEQGRKQQLILLDVIDLEVGSGIKHLNTVVVSTMERLARGVGRIGDITA